MASSEERIRRERTGLFPEECFFRFIENFRKFIINHHLGYFNDEDNCKGKMFWLTRQAAGLSGNFVMVYFFRRVGVYPQ